jgi:Pentapeptide repeats (8 copies)
MDPWLEAVRHYTSLDERARSDYWQRLSAEQQLALSEALKSQKLASATTRARVNAPVNDKSTLTGGLPLRARLADSLVLCFAGWCLFALSSEKIFHPADRSVRVLLLLLFSLSGLFLGLFLNSLSASLDRIGVPSRYLMPAVRVIATGAIGAYAIDRFIEGCAAGLAVLFFGIFLLLILQALGRPPRFSVGVSSDAYPRDPAISGVAVGRQRATGALVASGVSEKLRELLTLVVSGVATGLLGGTLRAAAGIKDIGERASTFCLLPVSIVVFGVIIRLSSVGLIQGKGKLNGWKTGLAIVDGLIVSTLLAIAISAELPPAISWEGTVIQNQILWIPVGLALGFTWGVVFGSLRILVFRAIQNILQGRDLAGRRASTPRLVLGGAVEVVGEGEYDVEDDTQDGNQIGAPTAISSRDHRVQPKDGTEKLPVIPTQSSKLRVSGCSYLLAIPALLASMSFALMASMGIWESVKTDEDIGRLPKGCPKACQDVALDRLRLAGIDFSGADLSRAKLREADLEGANLRNAILRGALMFRVDLRNADLSGADLTRADLRRSVLLNARLTNTSLRGAYLRNATLQDLDLSTVDLVGADLRDAVYTRSTKWPAGFDIARAGLRLGD